MKMISKLPLMLFIVILVGAFYLSYEHLKANNWNLEPSVNEEEVFMSEEEKRKLEEAKELERIIKANEEALEQIEKNDSIWNNTIDPHEGVRERYELPEDE
jgi:hypothetical protein